MGYRADMRDADRASIRLIYTVNGKPMDYMVRLVRTTLHNGGRRWWFVCGRRGAATRSEDIDSATFKLAIPVRNLIGMDVKLLGELRHGLDAFDCC